MQMKCALHQQNEAVGVCVLCGSAVCIQCQRLVKGRILCPACYSELRQGGNPSSQSTTALRSSARYSGCLVFLLGLIPGLGHLFMGLTTKGAILLASAIFLPFLLPILIAYSAFDSVHTARRLNSGETVADWDLSTLQNALSRLGLPASSASWIFGAALAIVGIVLLLGNLTNLTGLLNWWELLPSTYRLLGRNLLALAMVGFGGFLIWRTMGKQGSN